MPVLKLNSHNLYFEVHGSGDPLVLIAGLASDSQSWLPIVEPLSKKYQVIVFDNRGVGRSSPIDIDMNISQMADDCFALIKHLNLSSVNVLGHSMGGMIAMNLAVKYPEMVDKLILVATATKLNNRNLELFNDWSSYLKSGMEKQLWFKNLFYWIYSSEFFEDKMALDQVVKMAIDYPYPQSDSSFENQVKAMSEFNIASEMNKIKATTLIINGEKDIVFPQKETRKIFKRIDKLKSLTIAHSAHSIHIENPEDFCKCINYFFMG